MKENIILKKTYDFAIRIVNLHTYLCEKTRKFEIAKQLLRSGTSIGANTEEAIGAESKKDFIHKLSIAYKEARETKYWLRLLRDTKTLDKDIAQSMVNDCEQILAIIGKIKITSNKHS